MTRTALIKQILRLAGVPELHARRFMESFLLRIAYLLQNGGSFTLNGVGAFELRSARKPGAAKGQLTDVVLCHLLGTSGEALVFNIPAFINRNKQPVDRFYSISINKPLIPVKPEAASPELLLFSGGDIAAKALDERVSRLIAMGEIVRDAPHAGKPVLDLNPRLLGMDSTVPADKALTKNTKTDTIASEEHVGWSFGNDWETELEEDEIIASSAHAPRQEKDTDDGEINWDFGFLDTPVEPAGLPKRPVFTPPPATPKKTEPPKDSFSVPLPAEPMPDFLPSAAVTKEYEIDLSEFDDAPEQQDESGVEALEDFDSIFKKSLAENVLFAPKPKKDEPPPPPPPETKPHFSIPEEYEIPAAADEGLTEEEGEEESEGSLVGALDLRKTRVPGMAGEDGKPLSRRKRAAAAPAVKKPPSKWRYLWYSLSTLLILGIGSVIYVRTFGVPSWLPASPAMEAYVPRKFVPAIVERDYLIPVSYPYAGASNRNELTEDMFAQGRDTSSAVPPAVNPVPGDKNNPEDKNRKDVNPSVINGGTEEPKPDPAADKKGSLYEGKLASNVKGNIYKEGSYYTVQLMASKDKKEAEEAVRLLISKGVNAFLRVADIPGKGIWYRVRAGQFATMQEAEIFSNKYSR